MHENNAVVPKIPLSTDPLYGYLFLALEVRVILICYKTPIENETHLCQLSGGVSPPFTRGTPEYTC